MAAGLAFDPAEYAAFKSGLSGQGPREAAPVAPAAPAGDEFDANEFQAFKAQRQGGGQQRPARSRANPFSTVGEAPSFDERVSGPMASASNTSTPLGAGMRAKADEALVGPPSAMNAAAALAMRASNAAGLNIPRNVGAAIASIPGVGNGRGFGDNYALAKEQEEALSRQYPKTALAGTVGGVIGGAVALPPIGRVADVGRIGQAALSGGLYGAAAEAADSKDATRALQAGLVGSALGGIGGTIIERAAPVITRLFARNAPFRNADGTLTDQAAGALREAGVDPAAVTPQLAQHLDTVFSAKGPSVAAAREAQAAEFGIPLSRGQAAADPRALALEGQALAGRSGPRAQEIGDAFAARQAEAVAGARDRFMGMAAGEAPRVESQREAFEAVADRARQAAVAQAERESVAQRGVDDALRAVRGRGETDALDGATAAAQGVRDAAETARGAYRQAYGEVGEIPGVFVPGAMDRVGSRVRDRLGPEYALDDVLTPQTVRALADLDNVPGIFNLQPGEGPDLRQIEQLRKRLVSRYASTAQNLTDRRALNRVLSEFDGHVEDAMGAGLFGPRQAAGATNSAADGFPGGPAPSTGAVALPAAGGRPDAKSETLTHYLARNGGIALDGDARAADLGRIMTPHGPLGRKGGRPIEEFRDQLASEGFIRPDSPDGMISRRIGDEVHDLIGIERGGDPVYRLADISRGGIPRDVGGRVADQSSAFAERIAPFRQQVVDDLAAVGVNARHVDPAHLDDAAGRLFRREAEHGADAYEAAVLARGGDDAGRAAPAGDIPFDGPTAAATSDALPIGDTAPAEAMRRARGLFREYKQAFAPRFAGDTAGNNLRRILERDASPNEVAGMLFGASGTGRVTGGQVQTLSRLREAVGGDSEAWRATQQALIARHLGGEGRDLGSRLDHLLRGEGRTLVPFLSDEQRAGLGRLRAAVTQSENARMAPPTWAADLERVGFDPNAIGRSLFGGSGALGAKPGAANEARAAKAFLGSDSQEWAGLRQAAVQRLTDPSVSAAKTVERLRDFTDGAGKGVAGELFSTEELGNLRRFAAALHTTIRPEVGGREMSGAAAKALAKAVDLVAGMVAFKVGGLPAAAGTYGAKVGQRALVGGVGAAQARRSFEGGAPRLLAPPPTLPLGQLATGEALGYGQQ